MNDVHKHDDETEFVAASGGGALPARLRRPLGQITPALGADELDLHILRLVALHPGSLGERPVAEDLQSMTADAKRQLLAQLQARLGITAPTANMP